MKTSRNFDFSSIKRAVVKIGSNVLTRDNGLNTGVIQSVSRQVGRLMDDNNIEIIIVSSGAMAAGLKKLSIKQRPDETPKRQAIAAVGQSGLMSEYETAFAQYNKKVAQILLTSNVMSDRHQYLNARNTLNTLLEWKVIPIINENDTVAVESIQFGDNDNLSAIITLLMHGDILINLTDIDGLFDKDPRCFQDAKMFSEICEIKKDIEVCAGSISGPLGRGGMTSKLQAAKKVVCAGIPMIIANGRQIDVLLDIFNEKECGTFFVPKDVKIGSKKRWIGYSASPEGKIFIDEGAALAIIEKGKSLLGCGVVDVNGKFYSGAPVEIVTISGDIIATGIVNYSRDEILKIKGLQTNQIKDALGDKPYDEVVHRDNLAVTFSRA